MLWYIIVRVTKSEEGLDYWDAGRWVAGAYLAGFAVRVLTHAAGLPDVLAVVLQIIVGLTVLDWLLKGQYGGEQAFRIVTIFVGVRILFALPWLLVWYLSFN